MLRHDHGNVELPGHACPQAQDLVGHHVAAVEPLHARNVRLEVCYRHAGLGPRHHRYAQVACEQDAADRVVKVEVALGVHEVRRQQYQFMASQGQVAATVWHTDHAVFGFAHLGEVRCKALPHT